MLVLLPVILPAQLNVEYFMKKGIGELASEKYTEAIHTFNVLIRARPDLAEPHLYRGRAKFSLGDLKGAEYDFTRAIMLDSYNPEAYYYRGVVKSSMYDYSSALTDFQKSLDRRPNDPNVLFSRGVTKIRMKNYAGAIGDFDTLILLRPDIGHAYLNRATAKGLMGDLDAAINDCNQAIRLNIYFTEAFIRRGLLHKEAGRFDKAIMDFDHAIKLEENNPLTYFYRAAALLNIGDTTGAIADFDKVIQLDPFNDLTLYNRGLIKASRKNFSGALDDFDKVLKINPNNVFTWYNRAIVQANMNNFQDAVNDFTGAIRLFPDFAAAFMGRASARQQLKDFEEAGKDYDTAMAIIEAVNDGADFGFINEQYSADSSYLKKIIEFEADFNAYNPADGRIQHQRVLIGLQPNITIRYYDSDIILAEQQRTGYIHPPLNNFVYNNDSFSLGLTIENISIPEEKKLLIANKVDSIMYFNPFDADNYFLKGTINWMSMNYSEALVAYDRVLDLKPDYAEAYFNRANVLFELIEHQYSLEQTNTEMILTADGSTPVKNNQEIYLPDFTPVIRDYDQVIKLNPKMSYAYYNRGNIKNRMRDFAGAIQDYSIATALNPDFAEAFYNRALTLIYLKQNQEACFDLSKAGELGITDAYNVIKRYCEK